MSEDSNKYYQDVLNQINDETSENYVKQEVFETEHLKGFKDPTKKVGDFFIANSVINMSNLKTMCIRNDDVFLIGYPKSG